MIRPYILEETNWKHLKDAEVDLVILPWGATEAHNYHLPYGTDNFEGKAIAEESARIAWEAGAKVMVLPGIPFGVNTGQADIFLDINLNPSTQAAILKDILQVLHRQGVKKFMILNSHGGNNWKSIMRELGLQYPELFLCVTHWFKAMDKTEYFENKGDHADEMETSLVMHLRPELVLPKEEWGVGTEKRNKIKAFTEDWAWTERPWSKISEDTGVGNPKASSSEKGERFFKAVCEKMAKLMVELAKADVNELYE
ncbi:creatininase family protein [Flavimarina sp. Hel_I_48]|uniref:creatininase family protein n=1 Tax=Flavimarina sp. Hel_I_48 TaxID=1392488 RepID=UPI0004DF2F1B|nr:creatininase family protein [Flavimarina sp. Hel_I_48]